MSASFDVDYFPAQQNTLLKEGRYKVLRKLGEGVSSSVWLISDSSEQYGYSYLSVKILTVDATQRHSAGESRELEALKRISQAKDTSTSYLPELYDYFIEKGPRGSHLCLITNFYATSVSALRRSAPRKSLPLHITRKILAMLADALAKLRKLGIIHTDVKLDNVLIKNWTSGGGTLGEYLEDHPMEYEGKYELDGKRYLIPRSQPIPPTFSWDASPLQAESMTICLVDFGQAQIAGEEVTADDFSAVALRAPEIIIQSDFCPAMDVWAIGCLTFELLVGRWLFHPEGSEFWTFEDDHLAKMMALTGQRFPEPMLKRSCRRQRFFDDEGNLLRIPDLGSVTLERAIANYKMDIPDEEVKVAADFIRACLRFDYKDRATPADLRKHPFLENALSSKLKV